MPLDYIEFSKKIKTKYPEYSDVDDLTLARKMVEKYPEYKNEVTFGDEPVKKKEVSQSMFDQGGISSAMSKMAQNQPSVSSVEKPKKKKEEIFTGYPGKEEKKYKLDSDKGFSVWKEYSSTDYDKKTGKQVDKFEKQITDPTRVAALNKQFGVDASTDPIEQIYTNYSEDKKDNEYRISNNQWQRKVPGATEWTDIINKGSIEGLNNRYNKNIKFNPEAEYVKPEPKLKFTDVNTSLVGKTEEAAADILSKKYSKYGFTFEQTGYGTDYIIARSKDGKETTVSFDEKNPEEALKLRTFLEQNASKQKSNTATTLENKIKDFNSNKYASAKGPLPGQMMDENKDLLEYIKSDEYTKELEKLTYDEVKDQFEEFVKPSFSKKSDLDEIYKSKAYGVYKNKKKAEFAGRNSKVDALYTELRSVSGDAKKEKEIKAKITSYLTDDVIQDQVKSYSMQLNDLNNAAKKLEKEKKDYIKSLDAFNGRVPSMTKEQYDIEKQALDDKAESIATKSDSLMVAGKSIQKDQKKLNIIAGEYVTEKSKAGSFGGGLVNSFLNGVSKTFLEVPYELGQSVAFSSDYFRLSPEEKKFYKDKGYSEDQVRNLLKNKELKDFKSGTRKAIVDIAGADQTTEEYMKSEDRGFFEKAIYGVAESAPAMLLGAAGATASFAGLAAQSYSSIEDEMLSDPDFETSSAGERAVISVPYSILMGVLENYGLKNTIKGESFTGGLMKNIMVKVADKLPANATRETLEALYNKEIKSLIGKGVFKIVNGAVAEFETGATQALVLDIGLKSVYNKMIQSGMTEEEVSNLSVGELFATPDTFGEVASTVLEDGLAEAIGGATISTFSTVASGLINGNISLYNEKDLEFLKEVAGDKGFKGLIVANLKADMLKGKLTKSEAQEKLQAMNELESTINSVPDNLSPMEQIDSVNMIVEKNRLTKEIQGKDPALVAAQTERINVINEELKKISKNAVQVQTTSEVPLQPEARVGEEVVQGESETKPQGITEEGKEVEALRAKEQEEIRAKFPDAEYKADGKIDADKLSVKDRKAFDKIYAKYDKLISPLLEAKGKKEVVSGIEIVMPTEQQAEERKAARSTSEYVDNAAKDLPEISVEEMKEELNGEFGMLSGENPMAKALTEEENVQLNNKAVAWLQNKGYNPKKIIGKYGQAENSFFVPGLKRADAIAFAKEFNQDSVAHSDGLVYQDGSMNPRVKENDDFSFGEYTPESDYVSVVRTPEGLRTVSVGYDFENKISPDNRTVSDQDNLITQDNFEEQRSKQTTAMGQKIVTAAKLVMKALPGVKIYVHQKAADYENAIGEKTGKLDKGAYGNGEIHINLEGGANLSTLYHEAIHYALEIKGMQSGAILDMAKGLQSIISDRKMKDRLANFIKDYKKENKAEEYLVELGAIMAESKMELSTSKLLKFKLLLGRLAKKLGIPAFSDAMKSKDAIDFINGLTRDIRTGKEIKGDNITLNNTFKKQAVTIMEGKESMEKYGLSKGKNITRKIGEALESRQRSKHGTIDQKDNSPEARKKISNWMVDEVKYFVEIMGDKSGKGWYGELYQKSLDRMSKIFPEMKTDQNARDLFTMLVAITSDGQKVMTNFKLASEAYDYYKKNGVMPTTLSGLRVASFKANLKRINELLVEYNGDIAAIKKDLMDVRSIQDINKKRKKEGLDPLKTSWSVSFKAPFAASVFGPKLGMFYSNLSGNEAYPTLDRWWSRTFNRYRGTLIPTVNKGFNTKGEAIGLDRFKSLLGNPEMSNEEALLASRSYRDSYAAKGYKDGTEVEKAANTIYKTAFENINDAPFNSRDRQFMYDTISNAVNKLNKDGYDLSIADVQAILWYFEKNLYKTLGVQAKIEGISYEDAANYTYDKWKESGEKFNYEIKTEEEGQAVEDADEDIEEEQKPKFKKQKITSENSSNYANLTEDDKGNFVFFHRGGNDYEVIKKSSGGTTATSRDEASAISKVGGVAMYYTRPTDAETMVQGTSQYAVKVKNDKVYDFNSDPLNIIKEARERFNKEYPGQAFNPNVQFAYVTKIANEKGYDMTVAEWDGRTRAQSVVELKPDDVQVTKGNQVVKKFDESYESNTDKGFQSVIPEDKQKKLDAVYAKIYSVRNSEARYDDLYRLQEEATKLTEDQITDMIVNSDLSQEIKDEYQAVVSAPVESRRSFKKQRANLKDQAVNKAKEKYDLSVEERGNTHKQGVESALNDLRKSSWYNNADDTQRENAERELKEFFGERLKKAPSVAKILGKPKAKKVAIKDEYKAMITQIKLEAKAAREARADVNSKRKMLASSISGMVKAGKIKTQQAAVLIKRISYLNLDNPVMIDRFTDYAGRVFERADYQDILSKAFKVRADIRKLLKTKNQAQVVGMAKAFSKIDPSMVDDIDTYMEMADKVKNAVKPSRIKDFDVALKEATNIENISEYTKDEITRQEEIKKKELLATHDYLKEISDDMSLKDIQDIINILKEDPEVIADKEEKIKNFLINRFDLMSGIVQTMFDKGIDPMTGEQIEFDEKQKELMRRVIKMDLNEMSVRDAITIVEGVENFLENNITSGLEAAVSTYEGDTNVKSLVARGKKAREMNLVPKGKVIEKVVPKFRSVKEATGIPVASRALGRLYSEQFFSIPLMFEKMFGGVMNAGDVMNKIGFTKLINGVSNAVKRHAMIVDSFAKQDFYTKKIMNAANVYEVGMVAYLKRSKPGTPQEIKAEFNEKVNKLRKSIKNLIENGSEKEVKMGKIYEEVFNKLNVDSMDIDVILANTSDNNLKAIDWWIEQWGGNYSDLSDISLSVYNTELGSDLNYTPVSINNLSTKGEKIESGSLERGSSFGISTNYTDKKKTGVLMEATGDMGKDQYVNLDFFNNNSNALKGALIDINTASAIRQIDGAMKSEAFRKLIPSNDDRALLEKRLNNYIRRAKGKKSAPKDTIKYLSQFFNYISTLGVGKALGSVAQAVMQTAPMISTIINAGRFDIATKDFNDWLDRTGMSTSNRGLESQSTIESIDRNLEAVNGTVDGILKFAAKANTAYLKFFLSNVDVMVARSAFKSYYLQDLKRRGISTDIDWNTHEVNQESADYADQMVTRQQNVSDPLLAGEFLASDDPTKMLVRKVILPFASFILNQKARMYNDLHTAFSPTSTNEDRVIALRSFVGLLAELTAFQGMGFGIRTLYSMIADYTLGGDDEEEEKKKSFLGWKVTNETYNATKYPVKSIFNDLISPIPIADGLTTAGLNSLLGQLEYLSEKEIKDAVNEKNRILEIKRKDPMSKDQEKEFIENLKEEAKYQVFSEGVDKAGNWGMLNIAYDTYKETSDIIKLSDTGEFMDDYQGRETLKKLLPAQKESLYYDSKIMIAFSLGILPKDFATVVKKRVSKVKKKAVTEKQYERFDEVQKELGRDLKSWEIDMVKDKKEVGTAVDELNFVKRNGGLTESQGREYVKLVKLIGMPTVSDLDRIQRGEKADQILK